MTYGRLQVVRELIGSAPPDLQSGGNRGWVLNPLWAAHFLIFTHQRTGAKRTPADACRLLGQMLKGIRILSAIEITHPCPSKEGNTPLLAILCKFNLVWFHASSRIAFARGTSSIGAQLFTSKKSACRLLVHSFILHPSYFLLPA
jgi:hypothetical protein